MTDAGKAYNDNWRGEMDTSKNGYSILVKVEKGKSFITPYLRDKGFKPFGHGYCGCNWIWVLLDWKKYAYGMFTMFVFSSSYVLYLSLLLSGSKAILAYENSLAKHWLNTLSHH